MGLDFQQTEFRFLYDFGVWLNLLGPVSSPEKRGPPFQ